MKKVISIFLILVMLFSITACSNRTTDVEENIENKTETSQQETKKNVEEQEGKETSEMNTPEEDVDMDGEDYIVKIIVGSTTLTAVFENNVTTRKLISRMPMTLQMNDLFGREMCYNYGSNAFPTEKLRSDSYQVGDIVYWAPAGSFVILYDQNGEQFERQQLGHIEEGVEVFKSTGSTEVTFELAE